MLLLLFFQYPANHRHSDLLQRHNAAHGKDQKALPLKLSTRIPIACNNCSRAKTKCDTVLPCSRCATKNLKCTQRLTRRALKKASPSQIAGDSATSLDNKLDTISEADGSKGNSPESQPQSPLPVSSPSQHEINSPVGNLPGLFDQSQTVASPGMFPGNAFISAVPSSGFWELGESPSLTPDYLPTPSPPCETLSLKDLEMDKNYASLDDSLNAIAPPPSPTQNHVISGIVQSPVYIGGTLNGLSKGICGGFRGAGLVPYDPEHVISNLDIKLQTPPPPPVASEPSPWQSKTPSNPRELQAQTDLIRSRMTAQPASSPTQINEAVEHLIKGATTVMHAALLLREEVKELQAANAIKKPRQKGRKKRIQEAGVLTVQEGQDIIRNAAVEEQMRLETQRSQGAQHRCRKCGGTGHNARTCVRHQESNAE